MACCFSPYITLIPNSEVSLTVKRNILSWVELYRCCVNVHLSAPLPIKGAGNIYLIFAATFPFYRRILYLFPVLVKHVFQKQDRVQCYNFVFDEDSCKVNGFGSNSKKNLNQDDTITDFTRVN